MYLFVRNKIMVYDKKHNYYTIALKYYYERTNKNSRILVFKLEFDIFGSKSYL